MKIACWNVCQGGTKRVDRIISVLRAVSPDVCAIGEYEPRKCSELSSALADEGWIYPVCDWSETTGAGVLIASRVPISRGDVDDCPQGGRWLHVTVDGTDLNLGLAYCPIPSVAKGEYWDWLIASTPPLLLRKTLIVGDMNTGLWPADHDPGTKGLPRWRKMESFLSSGWTDLYRLGVPDGSDRSYWTWNGTGFRIDHGFGSPSLLPSVTSTTYVHTEPGSDRLVVDRVAGASKGWTSRAASDHALLQIELSPT